MQKNIKIAIENIEIFVSDASTVEEPTPYKYGKALYMACFVVNEKDKSVNDISTAVAKCGIVRTKDLDSWERLPDVDTKYQQRNVGS